MTLNKSAVGDEGGDGSQDEEESGREAGFAFSGSWRHWMNQQESFKLQRLRHKPDCSSWYMKNGETLLFMDLSFSCCWGTSSPARICLRLSLWLWCSTSFFIFNHYFLFGCGVAHRAELLALKWSSLSEDFIIHRSASCFQYIFQWESEEHLLGIMDDDFDRRMELRRQRREQMRQEAQKWVNPWRCHKNIYDSSVCRSCFSQ